MGTGDWLERRPRLRPERQGAAQETRNWRFYLRGAPALPTRLVRLGCRSRASVGLMTAVSERHGSVRQSERAVHGTASIVKHPDTSQRRRGARRAALRTAASAKAAVLCQDRALPPEPVAERRLQRSARVSVRECTYPDPLCSASTLRRRTGRLVKHARSSPRAGNRPSSAVCQHLSTTMCRRPLRRCIRTRRRWTRLMLSREAAVML